MNAVWYSDHLILFPQLLNKQAKYLLLPLEFRNFFHEEFDYVQLPFRIFRHTHLQTLRLRYHNPMKPPPDNPEFAKFTEAMRQIMKVPKAEIQERMEATKTERRARTSVSPAPVSASKA